MTRPTKLLLLIPIGLAAIAVFTFAGGQLVKFLWNWLLPDLFGFPQVTFWQAVGILALGRLLFGGMGMGGGSGSHYRRRWEAMTPEEREIVRERMRARRRERWGRGPAVPEPPNVP